MRFQFLASSVFFLLQPSLLRADEKLAFNQFLDSVAGQNLELKTHASELDAAEAASAGFAIPAPMIGITQLHDQSGNARGFEVGQTIPFPTKLTNDHAARKHEAEAHLEMHRGLQREVFAEARLLYFRLWQSQERISLLKEKRSALEQHLKLANAGARGDSFLRIHVLKAESDFDLLESDILSAEQAKRDRQIELASFLNRDSETFQPIAEEPSLATIPSADELGAPAQLEAKKWTLAALESRESEAQSAWLPDFNFRYREMGGTSMNPRYSEIMVGASLPFLVFWEPRAASAKATAEKMQGEVQLEKEKRKVNSSKTSLITKAESLRKQLALLKDKLLPRAEKRMKLVHNLAPRDMETLQDHRETMESFPELKLKGLELRGQYEETIAELMKYSRGSK